MSLEKVPLISYETGNDGFNVSYISQTTVFKIWKYLNRYPSWDLSISVVALTEVSCGTLTLIKAVRPLAEKAPVATSS